MASMYMSFPGKFRAGNSLKIAFPLSPIHHLSVTDFPSPLIPEVRQVLIRVGVFAVWQRLLRTTSSWLGL